VIKIAALVDTVAPSAAGIPAALIEIKAVWYAVTPLPRAEYLAEAAAQFGISCD
jgi:hypothetical protein